MRRILAGVGVLAISVLGGCVTAAETPEWLAAREAEIESSYPALSDMPRMSDANTDAAYWQQVKAELLAAGQAVRENPRAQPATDADDPQRRLDEARREIEETRQAHEPN